MQGNEKEISVAITANVGVEVISKQGQANGAITLSNETYQKKGERNAPQTSSPEPIETDIGVIKIEDEKTGTTVVSRNGQNNNNKNNRGHNKNSRPQQKRFSQVGKRTRPVKLASVQDSLEISTSKVRLPSYQYETTLIRRAIWPGQPPPRTTQTNADPMDKTPNDNEEDDYYGDVSLGMQFQLAEGQYIVKCLIPLRDGRASPAQLTGCIQRGDVLIQINHQSLLHIPPYQFMMILKRLLMTPNSKDGSFPRRITLRFARGLGLDILQRHEREEQALLRQRKALAENNAVPSGLEDVDGAADVLGLFSFAMVDQLSGMPMFANQQGQESSVATTTATTLSSQQQQESLKVDSSSYEQQSLENQNAATVSSSLVPVMEQHRSETQPLSRTAVVVPLEEAISRLIAKERHAELEECDSEFFSWNDSLSPLLRKPVNKDSLVVSESGPASDTLAIHPRNDDTVTKEENTDENNDKHNYMLDLGHEAVKGARKLAAILEKIDRGWSDRRSFQSLSATLSLYSKASTRRRYVLNEKSMPINFEQVVLENENESCDPSTVAPKEDGRDIDNDGTRSMGTRQGEEDLNADEYLLRLAARDEIWKKQVIEFLEDVVQKLNKSEESLIENESMRNENENDAAFWAVSSELGNFLFGDRISKALMLHEKPQALPPEEITALLFDLITNVSATVPDQINAIGGTNASVRSCVVPFITMKKPAASSDVMLASRFLLEDVLPVWLKTFRPLPWEQRRVIWPLEKSLLADSAANTGSTLVSDDSMTVDSMNTTRQQPQHSPSGNRRKNKNLREQIEEQELNAQTREETRFLVTFYFTQKILPQILLHHDNDHDDSKKTEMDVIGTTVEAAKMFVRDYGAYLRLHTCIAYAAAVHSHEIIKILLDCAQHDPQHQESLRRFTRPSTIFFYEPAMLSAVLERLHNLSNESNAEQRLMTIHLCALAYPDVRPWQVDRECRGLGKDSQVKDPNQFDALYYRYLTYLLNPTDGHDIARRDSALVMEWSELSVRGYLEQISQQQSPGKQGSDDFKERKKNFYSVASKASSDHLAYTRDLSKLLSLSMQAKEYSLALDLASEILDDPSWAKKKSLFDSIISTLRTIGHATIESFFSNHDTTVSSQRTLNRIFRLFRRISGMGAPDDDDGGDCKLDIPSEIAKFLDQATELLGDDDHERMVALVRFMSKTGSPKELLLALVKWSSQWSTMASKLGPELYPVLRTILRRGAQDGVSELSASLQRVRQTRLNLQLGPAATEESSAVPPGENPSQDVPTSAKLWPEGGGGFLWEKMSRGMLLLAK